VDPSAAERRASLSGAAPVQPLSAGGVADLVGALAEELPLLNDAQVCAVARVRVCVLLCVVCVCVCVCVFITSVPCMGLFTGVCVHSFNAG
jgi:hypothetical protein